MCNIGRVKQIIANEAKPTTAFEVMITSIPIKIIKIKELVYVKRVQRMEDKNHK